MSYGMRVFDGAGAVTLDTTMRNGTFLGVIYIDCAGSTTVTGSVSVPAFTKGTPFHIVTNCPYEGWLEGSVGVNVVISGTTLTWTLLLPSYTSVGEPIYGYIGIIYGVY